LDGSVFPAIVISSVIYSNGRPVGLRGAIIDITERKHREEELWRITSFLDSIIENIPDMVFVKDAGELRFVRFNRAGEVLLGHSRGDMLGKNDYDFFPKEQADFFTEKDRNVLCRKEVLDIPEEPLETRNKGERILHTKKVPILDAKGEPTHLLGISEDITERKRSEEHLQETLERLGKAINATIQVLVSAVEVRDPYTAGHQIRSADLARAIATEMGLPQEKIDGIRMAGSIHDIGKLSVPAEILSKPTKLTNIEFSLIKVHPQKGYEMLKDVESPWPLAEIVYQHHERMDGSGYPRNLKGDDILIEARILAVADVVEAMASHRPYRPALGLNAALEEIENNKGTIYDADVADACLRLFREKGFQLERA
jgi:PAS domain S-box-containing protein